MILDINNCKTLDDILEAMDRAEAIWNERPQMLIVKRRVFAEIRKQEPLWSPYGFCFPPFIFDGAVIIYQEELDMWKRLREKSEPLEFWLYYWERKDKLLFDPFEPIIAIEVNSINHNGPPSPDYLGCV